MDMNKRRLMIIVVVVFVIVLSFFAGRYSVGKTYRGVDDINTGMPVHPNDDRAGIPPDSLHH